MEIKARQLLAIDRKDRLVAMITRAIDGVCQEEKYEITYAEINSALIRVLESNNQRELRELWKKD